MSSNIEFIKNLDKYELEKRGDIIAIPDFTKPKKFMTMPYCYMNGRIHIGHASIFTAVDIQANYQRMKGNCVLFPIGFHASGTPIVSCAQKVKNELTFHHDITEYTINSLSNDNQLKILYNMQIPISEFHKFCDPEYWIHYFSDKATEDLKLYGITADFSRSFHTTHLNPYYDSFIKWQFRHLISNKFIFKGRKNIIYCEQDNMPCGDHDRSTGEGVNPIKLMCNTSSVNTPYGFMILTISDKVNDDDQIVYGAVTVLISFELDGVKYICNESSYNNIKHQYDNVKYIETVTNTQINKSGKLIDSGTGFYCSKKYSSNFSYYEPETEVISRTGHICIVSNIEQTYINYADHELKSKIREYVKSMNIQPPEAKEQFKNMVEWLDIWGTSRKFGLGTKLPDLENLDKDSNELIDSLSDSTIYMAFYTIMPYIKNIPIDLLNDNLWDYIFLNKETNIPSDHIEIINKIKKEFNYWYPLDLRISGKDLIANHLTMTLFNHYAIWKDFKYLPQQYNIKGHLLLNGKKMSKSTGNFMTLRDAYDKYGTSITRFSLAYNTGYDDGDFKENELSAVATKLTDERTKILEYMSADESTRNSTREKNIWDNIFEYHIENMISICDQCYESDITRNIVEQFYLIIDKKNQYINRLNMQKLDLLDNVMKRYSEIIIKMMKPIVPQWSDNIISNLLARVPQIKIESNWPTLQNNKLDKKFLLYDSLIYKTIDKINNCCKKQKTNKIKVSVFKMFNSIENSIINDPSIVNTKKGKELGQYKASEKYLKMQTNIFGDEFISWVKNNEIDEFSFLQKYVPLLFNNENVIIEFVEFDNNDGRSDMMFCNPINPKVD